MLVGAGPDSMLVRFPRELPILAIICALVVIVILLIYDCWQLMIGG